MLYWTEWGTVARIRKASMDGSTNTTIHDANITRPYSLAIDLHFQMLYWGDETFHRIETSTVNGAHRRVITSISIDHPFSLSLLANNLYFSDWTFGVRSVNISGEETPTTIYDNFCDFMYPYGLRVISIQRQPQGIDITKSVLGRVYVTAWTSQLYTLLNGGVILCVPAMQNPCFVYIHVAMWLQVCCTVSGQNYPTKGLPCSIIHKLVATQFSQNYVLIQACILRAVTPPSQYISAILTYRS